MKVIKQLGYKLIVVMCVIATFCCFIASTPVEAKVKTTDFYYSGTEKGSYTVVSGNIIQSIIQTLGKILDYILSAVVYIVRIPFIGWTAIMEWLLTSLVEGAIGEPINLEEVPNVTITDSTKYLSMEAIVFNRVPILNINVFEFNLRNDVNGLGEELEGGTTQDIPDDSLVIILKKAIAGWYYSFRLLSIMVMLIMLVYIGLKIAIQTTASEKALYKRILVDWVVGMILVFSIHYIMLFVIQFNEILVDAFAEMSRKANNLAVYEYGIKERATEGITNVELEKTLYDEVRTRAFDAKLSVGVSGMVMYMVLVYYAWKYTLIYFKRYLTVAVLVIMAPLVAVTYAYNKVKSGKSTIFSNWLKEFCFIVILQSIHALMYVVFLDAALRLSLASIAGMIMAFVMLNFMTKAEKIFRKIFGITGTLTDSTAQGKLQDFANFMNNAALGIGGAKASVALTKGVANVVTKPIRAGAGYAFSKSMERKANKLEKLRKELSEKGELTDLDTERLKSLEKENKIKRGSLASVIKNAELGEFSDDEIRYAVSQLRSRLPMTKRDKNGNLQELSEEEYYEEFMEHKDEYAKEFDKMSSPVHLIGSHISKKWKQIMDPFQYVEKDVRIDNKYHRIKTKREKGLLSKKIDGTVYRLNNNLTFANLTDFTNNDMKNLGDQIKILKDGVMGFVGIFFGIPFLIAEPGIGLMCLSKGISAGGRAFSKKGKIKLKNQQTMKKYTFAGYEGRSVQTIAEGAQAYAREEVRSIEETRIEHDRKMTRRVKKKYPVAYQKIKLASQGVGLGGLTLGLAGAALSGAALPISAIAVGATSQVTYTGAILNRFKANSYLAMQKTINQAQKSGVKQLENDWKSTDAFLSSMADKYFQMEADKQTIAESRDTTKFETAYMAAASAMASDIENMSDAQLQLENNFEEEIVYEKTPSGKIKIAPQVENKLIDSAIIETVQKSGIMDITEYDLSAESMKQINKTITDKLIQKGIITKDTKLDDIIPNLETKVEQRKAVLDAEKPRAVEEKMTDDAIIEVMKEQGITDPTKVDETSVMKKFDEKFSRTAQVTTTESSSVVASMQEQANQGRKGRRNRNALESTVNGATAMGEVTEEVAPNGTAQGTVAKPQTANVSGLHETDKSTTSEEVRLRVTSSIQARKASLADRSKTKLSEKTKRQLRDELKRKRTLALDTMVLQTQDKLDSDVLPIGEILGTASDAGSVPVNVTNVNDGSSHVVATEEGSKVKNNADFFSQVQISRQAVTDVGPTNSDKIIEMLKLQTQMHQDKLKLETVSAYKTDAKEKARAMKMQLFDNDGSVRVDVFKDGSRSVRPSSRTASSYTSSTRRGAETRVGARTGQTIDSGDMQALLRSIKSKQNM